jgi:hypothetical protein
MGLSPSGVQVGEDLLGDLETDHTGRHAGIARDLEQALPGLLPGHTILQGDADVPRKLLRPVEDGDRADVEDAATAPVQATSVTSSSMG